MERKLNTDAGRAGKPGAESEAFRLLDDKERDVLCRMETVRTIDELSAIVALLSEIVKCRATSERTDIPAMQKTATCITRVRLLLNELTRQEVLSRGASRSIADRLLELEYEIRRITDRVECALGRRS